jgi:hypothetical protein
MEPDHCRPVRRREPATDPRHKNEVRLTAGRGAYVGHHRGPTRRPPGRPRLGDEQVVRLLTGAAPSGGLAGLDAPPTFSHEGWRRLDGSAPLPPRRRRIPCSFRRGCGASTRWHADRPGGSSPALPSPAERHGRPPEAAAPGGRFRAKFGSRGLAGALRGEPGGSPSWRCPGEPRTLHDLRQLSKRDLRQVAGPDQHGAVPVEVRSGEERRAGILHERLLVGLRLHPEDDDIRVTFSRLRINGVRPWRAKEYERLSANPVDRVAARSAFTCHMRHGAGQPVHVLHPRRPEIG